MNIKEISRRMDKKQTYKWGCSPSDLYTLFNAMSGKTIIQTNEHLTAEIITKKLRGKGFNIIGDVPAMKDLRD